MKKIEAIIKPYKFEEVRDALDEMGITGMTVTEVRGFGRQSSPAEATGDGARAVDLVPRIMIEVVVPDRAAATIVAAVVKSARTGKMDDGKVFIARVEKAVRIRTQQTGEQAI